MRKLFSLLILIGVAETMVLGQHEHFQSSVYQAPKDQAVVEKLEEWRDLKFGILIHWGLYAIPGIIESWSICSEDWIERDSTVTYDQYKNWYWGLKDQFNPVNFNPEQWAKVSKAAGMKYMVFTTKHHDGFCMFNTAQTDFSIKRTPFKGEKDITAEVLKAYRNQDFMVGTYFSKPDWHSPYYWWPKYATPNRNNNYDANKYPWRWNQFKQYTFNQIQELMTNYGNVDILWLDGGWVRPLETVNDEVRAWGAPIPSWSQDIDMPKIAQMARAKQPGLIMVDRTVGGEYENYLTPEQRIPDKALDYPWESCITLGTDWGFVPSENYKPTSQIIRNLVEVVSKGGSMLLGVGPKPDGTFSDKQVEHLTEIGHWMAINGDAIYETRTLSSCQSGNVFFTCSKNHKMAYAIACLKDEKEHPTKVEWEGNIPVKGCQMRLLASGKSVRYSVKGNKVIVELPELKSDWLHGGALVFAYSIN